MQVETLLDVPVADAIALMTPESEGKQVLSLSRLIKKQKPRSEIKTTKEITYKSYTVRELENGSIEVERDGALVSPAKPALRDLSLQLNIPLLNSSGNPLNTRHLGSQIIKSVEELKANEIQPVAPAER